MYALTSKLRTSMPYIEKYWITIAPYYIDTSDNLKAIILATCNLTVAKPSSWGGGYSYAVEKHQYDVAAPINVRILDGKYEDSIGRLTKIYGTWHKRQPNNVRVTFGDGKTLLTSVANITESTLAITGKVLYLPPQKIVPPECTRVNSLGQEVAVGKYGLVFNSTLGRQVYAFIITCNEHEIRYKTMAKTTSMCRNTNMVYIFPDQVAAKNRFLVAALST